MKTFIWGGGSKLRLLIPYLSIMGRKPDFVFDEFIKKPKFNFDGNFTNDKNLIPKYASECNAFIAAIGGHHGRRRVEISEYLKSSFDLEALNLINRTAYICPTASIGEGLMMMPGSVIHSYSTIKSQCIVNTNASIDHECHIGNGVHIMGGAVITGRVRIGDFATIGSNATVLPDLTVGSGAFVGAGAVVTKNVPDNTVVVGIPARIKN